MYFQEYSKAMELDPHSEEAKHGYKDCAIRMQSGVAGGADPEEVTEATASSCFLQMLIHTSFFLILPLTSPYYLLPLFLLLNALSLIVPLGS